jgi:hypothetical protein
MGIQPWQVQEKVSWHVTESPGGRAESAPKAHFFWQRGGAVCRAAEYGILELQAEIDRLEGVRSDTSELRRALACLTATRRSSRAARSGRRSAAVG